MWRPPGLGCVGTGPGAEGDLWEQGQEPTAGCSSRRDSWRTSSEGRAEPAKEQLLPPGASSSHQPGAEGLRLLVGQGLQLSGLRLESQLGPLVAWASELLPRGGGSCPTGQCEGLGPWQQLARFSPVAPDLWAGTFSAVVRGRM